MTQTTLDSPRPIPIPIPNTESDTESRFREPRAQPARETVPASPPHRVQFQVPVSVSAALDRAPTLGAVPRLRLPDYWQAEVRANPGVAYADEILKAEAWLKANPARAPRKDFPRFLHTWLGRAERNGDGHA